MIKNIFKLNSLNSTNLSASTTVKAKSAGEKKSLKAGYKTLYSTVYTAMKSNRTQSNTASSSQTALFGPKTLKASAAATETTKLTKTSQSSQSAKSGTSLGVKIGLFFAASKNFFKNAWACLKGAVVGMFKKAKNPEQAAVTKSAPEPLVFNEALNIYLQMKQASIIYKSPANSPLPKPIMDAIIASQAASLPTPATPKSKAPKADDTSKTVVLYKKPVSEQRKLKLQQYIAAQLTANRLLASN